MQVKACKEGTTFSVQADVGSGNVLLKPRYADQPEDQVTLSVHEPVTTTNAEKSNPEEFHAENVRKVKQLHW